MLKRLLSLLLVILCCCIVCLSARADASGNEAAKNDSVARGDIKIKHVLILDASGSMTKGGYGDIQKGYHHTVADTFKEIFSSDKDWFRPADAVQIRRALDYGSVKKHPELTAPVDCQLNSLDKTLRDPKSLPGPDPIGGWGSGLAGYLKSAIDEQKNSNRAYDQTVTFYWMLTDNGAGNNDGDSIKGDYRFFRDSKEFTHLWYGASPGIGNVAFADPSAKRSPVVLYLAAANLPNDKKWAKSFENIVKAAVSSNFSWNVFKPLVSQKNNKASFSLKLCDDNIGYYTESYFTDSNGAKASNAQIGDDSNEFLVTPFIHNGHFMAVLNINLQSLDDDIILENPTYDTPAMTCESVNSASIDFTNSGDESEAGSDGLLHLDVGIDFGPVDTVKSLTQSDAVELEITGQADPRFVKKNSNIAKDYGVRKLADIVKFLVSSNDDKEEIPRCAFSTTNTIKIVPRELVADQGIPGYVYGLAAGALVLLGFAVLFFKMLTKTVEYDFCYQIQKGIGNKAEPAMSERLVFSRTQGALQLLVGGECIGKIALKDANSFTFVPTENQLGDGLTGIPASSDDSRMGSAQSSGVTDGSKTLNVNEETVSYLRDGNQVLWSIKQASDVNTSNDSNNTNNSMPTYGLPSDNSSGLSAGSDSFTGGSASDNLPY